MHLLYTLAWEQLANGSIFKAVNTAYSAAIGAYWIIMLFIFTLIVTYVKTQNGFTVAAMGIMGSILMLVWLPPYSHVTIYTILVLSLATAIYKVWSSR